MLFNGLISDHNADAFKGTHFQRNQSGTLDRLVYNSLDGLNKWDSRYFISISKYGYQEISWIAFFPLYPILINILSKSSSPILHFFDYPTIQFLSAYAINLVCFTISSIALYKLTICLFNDKLFAINTVKWFSYNPASIFFSATYTESLYSSLILTAIWLLFQRYPKIQKEQNFDLILHNKHENRYKFRDRLNSSRTFESHELHFINDDNCDKFVKLFSHKWNSELLRKFLNEKCKFLIAILCLTFASFTRSNGIINVGFFWYLFLLDNFKLIYYRKIRKLPNFNNLIKFLILLISTCFVISPFFIVQYVHHSKFCSTNQTGSKLISLNSLLTKEQTNNQMQFKKDQNLNDQICKVQFFKLYSFVQEKYWNVGLFKYYHLRKIPNFILASPMLLLVAFIFKYFIESSKSTSNLIKSGLGDQFWNKTALLFPFILHLLFLTLFSLLFINIEVLTRLICSSSPLLFWSICKLPRKLQNYVKIYFSIYFFVGTFAFSNFLPWT